SAIQAFASLLYRRLMDLMPEPPRVQLQDGRVIPFDPPR
ncbi:MAG: hypothetical protein ACI8P9_004700, partial [Parasphingorhabdus sp.]